MPRAKKTPWFDGSVKPVRDGVYEVHGVPYRLENGASYGTARVKFVRRGRYAGWQRTAEHGHFLVERWRGLVEEPKS